MEKKELCVQLVGAAIMEKKCEVSSKQLKIELIHDQLQLWVLIQRNKSSNMKIYMHFNVHCSIIYSSQDM